MSSNRPRWLDFWASQRQESDQAGPSPSASTQVEEAGDGDWGGAT